MNSQQIRDVFTQFFVKNGHKKHPSSSLVPQDDPTLLFANAGMNQFKDYFTGKATPEHPRTVTMQKCVRAGGKHNDLDNVGFTSRHQTFFEMMGNFSFGDYFKKEAIHFHWELLTKEYAIPKDKLYVTVHHSDDEALEIWHKQEGLPLERIFKRGDKDNFWEMGEYGPCGPSSEFFYDWGAEHRDPHLKNPVDLLDDEHRYVEIGNLVFMQYEKTPEGLIHLPKPSVDTGTGLERIAGVLQGQYWNYDTDGLRKIIAKIEELSGKEYSNPQYTANMRVVADHIRSCSMLISDGVIPSNEGRGYVLRRIIRRAVRHLRELQFKEVTFYKLVPVVFETLGEEYPENAANAPLVTKFLQLEEKRFLETLDVGLKFLDGAIKNDLQGQTLPGQVAFKLYDTYGFPLDLTQTILQENKLKLDEAGFEASMQKQREASRKSWKGGTGTDTEKLFYELKEKHGDTEFIGYEKLSIEAKLLHKQNIAGQTLLIFDRTPFYGESGGQVGDIGAICEGDTILAQITDVQKPVENLFVHFSSNADVLEAGQNYQLKVDKQNREFTKRNHSATHLLQSALIHVLGDHIKQAGSLVNSEKLRFDFTHPEAMTKEQIQQVEDQVNRQIQKGLQVKTELMSKDEAIKKGAMAFFGEKYGAEVRVLSMGDYSVELCGGTHVSNTSEIECLSIVSEGSLSAGIRRLEALTSTRAKERIALKAKYCREVYQLFNEHPEQKNEVLYSIFEKVENFMNDRGAKTVSKIQNLFKILHENQDKIQSFGSSLPIPQFHQKTLLEKLEALSSYVNKDQKRRLIELQEKQQAQMSKDLFNDPETISQLTYKFAYAPEGSQIKKLSDQFINQFENAVLVLAAPSKGRLNILVRRSKSLKTPDCSTLLKQILELINGRGGGRSDMAQGSGESPKDIEAFSSQVKSLFQASLK